MVNGKHENGPPAIGLASWLGGGSTLIALLAVAAIAIACAVLIGRLINQQGLVRAQLAAASGREILRRVGEDALSDARVLAERPALPRLLGVDPGAGAVPEAPTDATGALNPFLRRFLDSIGGADLEAAVLRGNAVVAQSGTRPDWLQVVTAIHEQGERFVVAPRDGSALLWGGAAPIPGTDARALILIPASTARLQQLSEQAGAAMTVVNYAAYHAPPDDPMTSLHTQALSNLGHAVSTHLRAENAFASTAVIAAQTGEVVGLLDARVSAAEFSHETRSFEWILGLTALAIALIAGILGTQYGRWLARPVVALRDIAERFGRGDFTAAVPAVAPLEVGALARSMDQMRRDLLDLTDALRRREAEAQAVLNGVVEGVFAVDPDRRIRYANPQVARMLKREAKDIVGSFCGDVLSPRAADGTRPCERHCPILAARSGEAASSAHESLCLPDGTTRSSIVASSAPVQGVQVQILRDETELEAVRRARDDVFGNLSHEFRTPLAAQLASIELLRDGLSAMPHEAQAELVGGIERGVLRMMQLIDNLLESVRIEAGQRSIRQQPVRLDEVIDAAHDLIAPLLPQRGLTLQVDRAGLAVTVRGDSPRLEQVFVNLLANAIKFAPEGSAIHVGGARSAQARPAQDIWVEDEGAGPPSGGAQLIFQRFQRGASEPDAPGLGLGLWIVRSIVERHGGSVRVERTAQARTRFIVTLPIDVLGEAG